MGNKTIRILIASSNKNKLKEINYINKNSNIIFDVIDNTFEVNENGESFEENALIKAKSASKIYKTYCLADDSGLCVDVLKGRPGIYSSRYAKTPEKRIEKLLNEMKNYKEMERSAHFTCYMVLVDKYGELLHKEEGKIEGYITNKACGCNGFGYDPIFFVSKYNKTIAQLDESEKNKISHRAMALIPMIKWIENNLL